MPLHELREPVHDCLSHPVGHRLREGELGEGNVGAGDQGLACAAGASAGGVGGSVAVAAACGQDKTLDLG